MAHLWMKVDAGWAVAPLRGDAFELSLGPEGELGVRPGEDRKATALLLRQPAAAEQRWALLCRELAPESEEPAVYVNGEPVLTGLRALEDLDELRIGAGDRTFFSTETLATVQPYPSDHPALPCARCRQDLTPGTPGVACPQCGVWHHQTEDLPCWTYSENCAYCDQPTDLGSGYRWTPEEL